ncbi:hypothetical protein [Psychromicrobium lacuslunae]|uniref:hypothetical protein n=1 Tax=Psychromicrobium lacuslunae TaxID=1618207 RepID=UPI000B27C616|nr:hypothetical protein [Psychromicrobium lacuslunae]
MSALPQERQFEIATRRKSQLSAVSGMGSAMPSGEAIQQLQSQIHQAQGSRLETRSLPTHPDLRPLLPAGTLQAGSSYAVQNSTSIAIAMLAGPSSAGLWCGVVGVPDFNVEAAAEFGIDLAHLVLIPHPGENWLAVTAALVDITAAVLINPPAQPSAGQMARLSARLRQREAVLISQAPWSTAEAELRAAGNSWQGLDQGHGQLNGRSITVAAAWRSRKNRAEKRAELRLPGSMPQLPGSQALSGTQSEKTQSEPLQHPALTLAVGR